jgi:predicted nuclease of predicted toxin-antitoxin system
MKVLADANIEGALVRWLRAQHHDVVWAAELAPSTPDSDLLELANGQERILLTYDHDFGELVFLRKLASQGIVLLRFDAALQVERLALLQRHWPSIEAQAARRFLVVSDRRVRMRPLP